MANLINRKAVKTFILDQAKDHRPGWPCTRVSKEGLDMIESMLRNRIVKLIHSHPTIGKTFRP